MSLPPFGLRRAAQVSAEGGVHVGEAVGRGRVGAGEQRNGLVALSGAAGMYALENEHPDGRGFESYGEALWWTAMVMTTMGSDYFPQTTEGRALCFLLAVYAFAVFGYVTATLATFFVGRDAANEEAEVAGAAQVESLRAEVAALHEELRAFVRREAPGARDVTGERAGG